MNRSILYSEGDGNSNALMLCFVVQHSSKYDAVLTLIMFCTYFQKFIDEISAIFDMLFLEIAAGYRKKIMNSL